jgi:hypothetical protein
MLFSSIVTTHLLNIRLDLTDSLSLSFAVSWAFCNSLSSKAANSLDAKNSVSFVYMFTTLKASFLVVINRQRLYDKVVISSFSL